MTGAFHHPTRSVVRLSALLALAVAAVAGFSAARDLAPPPQAPDKSGRPPEDEDPDARPISHHVTSDEPDDAGPKTVPAPRAVDFKTAARDAKHFAVQTLFNDLAVPHDQVKFNEFISGEYNNKPVNIVPIPDYVGEKLDTVSWPLEVTPFPATSWTPGDPIKAPRNAVDRIMPYENLALDAVNAFLNQHYEKSTDPKKSLSRYDQDVIAAQVLTTVLLRLQSARQTKTRSGAAWDAVEDALKQRLLGVLLEELDDRVQARQWDDAFALTKELAGTYRSPQDQTRIAGPLAGLVRESLASVDEQQRAEARRRLRQLEDLFPNSALIQPVSDELQKQAKALFEAAKQENNKEQRDQLLKEAREAWPGLPGLRSYAIQQSNQHPTLRVGVRELPGRMSPGRASTDSDLRAVELLFESLVKLEPDGAGGARWAPGLALGRPGLVPRGRRFQLPPDARWSGGERMTARDVAETVNLIKAGRLTRRPRAWGAKLDRIDNIADPYQVYLTLPQGWLDPLALMNFKVLPPGVDPDSPDFAANPRGSGPYVYAPNIHTDEGRACVAFTANPNYAARPGKAGLPLIDEIHFIAYTFKDEKDYKNDHKDELDAALQDGPGRLDLLLDLNAREAAALARNAADLHVKLTGRAAPNRRIYFLAVNNEKAQLDNAAFRCALAYAINRDTLLDKYFRASPGQDLHTPLNGPYPVGSWAANPKEFKTHGDKTTLDSVRRGVGQGEAARIRRAGRDDLSEIPVRRPARRRSNDRSGQAGEGRARRDAGVEGRQPGRAARRRGAGPQLLPGLLPLRLPRRRVLARAAARRRPAGEPAGIQRRKGTAKLDDPGSRAGAATFPR